MRKIRMALLIALIVFGIAAFGCSQKKEMQPIAPSQEKVQAQAEVQTQQEPQQPLTAGDENDLQTSGDDFSAIDNALG